MVLSEQLAELGEIIVTAFFLPLAILEGEGALPPRSPSNPFSIQSLPILKEGWSGRLERMADRWLVSAPALLLCAMVHVASWPSWS